jgi:hypothetical protein
VAGTKNDPVEEASMKPLARQIVLFALSFIATATAARAQAIAGVVTDNTGAVLPGVTVEASSPALIEKSRSAVTDGAGQYRIVNLSPGTYTVSFSLPGFNTARREGIVLTTDFIASVNVELRIGALEETVTVSGQSPLVDVQTVAKQTVFTRELLDALPTARTIQAAGALIPGVTGTAGRDVGGTTMLQQTAITFRQGQTIQLWDGFWLSNVQGSGTGGATSFYVNASGAQELSYSTGADAIQIYTNGIALNMVPKDGGNTFRGTAFGDFSTGAWQANNLNDAMRARGVQDLTRTLHNWEINPGFGGPIERNKLWFYGAFRYQVLERTIPDSYYDKNPAWYIYEPDFSRPTVDDGRIPNESLRLTWQIGAKDKVAYWFTNQNKQRRHFFLITGLTPEATGVQKTPHAQAQTIRWSRTQTSRLLFEAGGADGSTLYIEYYQPEVQATCFPASCTPSTRLAITDQATGKSFGAYPPGWSEHGGSMQQVHGAATYVTGTHAFKGGVNFGHGVSPNPTRWIGDATLTYNNGRPQSVTLRIPRDTSNGWLPDLGLYAQDRWTIKRATMSLGLRYDYFVSHTLDRTLPESRWNPAQFFEGLRVVQWHDLSPRLGVAFDLFGNGKTALKGNFGKYLAAENVSTASTVNPQLAIGATDTRTWQDLNSDFTIYNPDGSLQTAELGPSTNTNFGKVIPSNQTTDPRTLKGWSSRPSTSEWQASVQHELTSRLAVTAGYYFRYFANQIATDNTLVTDADFDGPFCIAAPASSDLPGGGAYPVCGLYDIKPTSRGRVQNHRTFARNFGRGIIEHLQGYELSVNARLGRNSFVNVGIDASRRLLDTCDVPITGAGAADRTVDSPEKQFCRQVTPFRPDVKIAASQTLPWDLQVSGTYLGANGQNTTATWNVPNTVIAPALGRDLAAGRTANKAVQLIEPGKYYLDRLHQIDLRLSRLFTLRRYRLRADVNVYNALNATYVNSFVTAFTTVGANSFLRPTDVLAGRTMKISGQIDF